jgi:hypothetical protein
MEPTFIYADPESNVMKAERETPLRAAKFVMLTANLAAAAPRELAASSVQACLDLPPRCFDQLNNNLSYRI